MGKPSYLRFNEKRREIFCKHLARLGRKVQAAQLTGVAVHTVNNYLREGSDYYNPEFADLVQEAFAEYGEKLLREVDRRGRKGVVRNVYQGGRKVGRERKFSDNLLLRLTQMYVPEFSDTVRVDQKVSGSLDLKPLEELTPENQEKLRQILTSEIARQQGEGRTRG